MSTAEDIIQHLKEMSDTSRLEGMKRFGIDTSKAIGIPVPELRKLAKILKTDHQLSLDLWKTGIHEARILASMIGDPKLVTEKQFDEWTNDFNSWDVCDQACGNLLDRTPYAIDKAIAHSKHQEEFVKRAGFVLMAEYAMHNKKAENEVFMPFFPIMEREAWE
ncbi:MAG: DNA alkylation repair protein [Sphingobacteriales bacterium]|nr:MAG: DNA alkylation repair protein [Sphingobacteriales bacterium]